MTLKEKLQQHFSQQQAENARREKSIDTGEQELSDCFVSRWAGDLMERLYRRQLDILQNGGKASFPVICDEQTGDVLPHRYVKTRFGTRIRVDSRDLWLSWNAGHRWPKHGLCWGRAEDYAWARIAGSGMGLAGATSCTVVAVRCEPYDAETVQHESEIRFQRGEEHCG